MPELTWAETPWTPRQKALLVGSPCIAGLVLALGCGAAWWVSERRYWRNFRLTDD